MTPAELWIDLFVFFSMSFESSENVVSIRKVRVMPTSDYGGFNQENYLLERSSHQRGEELEVQKAGH